MEFLLLGPILFIVIVLILERVTPNYEWRQRYISELSLYKFGWIQKINFVVSGLLITSLCIALFQIVTIPLVKIGWLVGALCGLATAAAGVWDTEIGMPRKSRTGKLHDWTWYIGSPGLAASFLCIGLGYAGHAWILVGSMLVVIFDLVWFRWSGKLGIKPGVGQRMVIFSSLAWSVILALWTMWQ